MIYVKQINNIWTFCNTHGTCVHADGRLAYHPDFFDERPEGYPLYVETLLSNSNRTNRVNGLY